MATSKSIHPRVVRREGNILHVWPQRRAADPRKPDQYRQDIWDSFPHLRSARAEVRTLDVHPYFAQE